MRLVDVFKEKWQIADENMKMRKGKFEVEQKLIDKDKELEELNKKYINLLEEKSEQFDLYVKYQEQCVSYANDKRELKKQLAESNEKCTMLSLQNEELIKKIDKLERKTKTLTNQLKKQDEKST